MLGCTYDQYHPATLRPLNLETEIRLAELGWSEAEFRGRSVLDIGSNTGLLSILACQLGAASVHATDVTPAFVEAFARVAAENNLPVTVEQRAFSDLQPEHAADVVLFMEVIHWTTSQGIPIPTAIERLARLTRETLYIEFPWSVDEPSIQAQTKLTAQTYSADVILEELSRYFSDVRLISFMHYFGHRSGSRRALVRASGRRAEAEVLMALPKASIVPSSFRRGRNGVSIANSPDGLHAIKAIPRTSALHGLDETLLDEIMRGLTSATTIVPPRRLGASYCVRSAHGQRMMAFPLITNANQLTPSHKHLTPSDVIVIAQGLHRDLAPLSHLAPALRHAGLDRGVRDARKLLQSRVNDADFLSIEERDAIERHAARELVATDLGRLCHLDLQGGNVVCERDVMRVVDIDNLGLATGYTDGLLGLLWAGGGLADIEALERALNPLEGRSLAPHDIICALSIGFGWRALADEVGGFSETAIRQFGAGTKAMAQRLMQFSEA